MTAAAVAMSILPGAPAAAQTADDFFNGDAMHEIRLFIHSNDWRKLLADYRENTYYPCDLEWRNTVVHSVGIRSRGGGTRSDAKPGLRVDIDRYSTAQEFLGLKSFVLDNLVGDPALIKERLTMRFFQRMGLPAPRETHARLYVNDMDMGVYAIVESIDKSFLKRVFGGEDGAVQNDGYLFEYKWRFPYDFSYLGPDLDEYASLYEPKTREQDRRSRLYGPIEEMTRMVNEASDDEFLSAVSPYLDLRLFMKYLAVENFLAERDGFLGHWGMNNFYHYRFENTRRVQFLPWDKDSTFHAADHPIWYNTDRNVLMWRAMAVPELREAYVSGLLECAEIASERGPNDEAGWLEREIMRIYRQITGRMEQRRSMRQSDGDPLRTEVDKLLDFARTRSRFVRCEVANAPRPSAPSQACASLVPPGPLERRR